MLKVEVIKLEIQDIITTSGDGVANGGTTIMLPDCTSGSGHNMTFQNIGGTWQMACSHCGYTGSANTGDTVIGGGG